MMQEYTLWQYARMARDRGRWVMGLLEGRVGEVVLEYNAQAVANTLWAYATMGREPGGGVMGLLEGRALFLKDKFACEHRRQVHQYLLSCSLPHSSQVPQRASLLQLRQDLGPACQDAFVAAQVYPSESQQHVRRALCGMGLSVEEEARCLRSGYSIDMLAREPNPSAEMLVRDPSSASDALGESAPRPTAEWAVEFDGPSHFLASGSPTGATLLKRRHLQLLGYHLISVPYWEWDKVKGDNASEETYLRSRIAASLVRVGPRPPRSSPPLSSGDDVLSAVVVASASTSAGEASARKLTHE